LGARSCAALRHPIPAKCDQTDLKTGGTMEEGQPAAQRRECT
jgi:hypothetical protein